MKSKKILIHGSINTANFGDVLFAEMFFNYIKDNNLGEPHFLATSRIGISDYVRKYISYYDVFKLKDIKKASLIVFMSGGYLGDSNKSIRGSLTRWGKYPFVYLIARFHRVPVVVCGVGGGPLYHWFNRMFFCSLLKYAKFVTVRDEQTKEYFETLGVKNKINSTTDSAILLTDKTFQCLDSKVKEELHNAIGDKKKLYIHVPHTQHIIDGYKKELIPAINQFIAEHPEFGVVFITDEQHGIPINLIESVDTKYKYVYHYTYPDQLCAFLSLADVVVTAKLHVGIISASFGLSVISFPLHQHKTWRFYAQINETDRSVPFSEMTQETVLHQLNKYYNMPITISSELRTKAAQNLSIIQNAL